MKLRRSLSAALGLVLALSTAAFWACGSSDDPTDPGGGGGGGGGGGNAQVINLTSNLTFSPSDVTIDAGTTVRWVNQANITHTVTPDGHSEWNEWVTNASGETFEHTFNTTGTFNYFCSPHLAQGMTGVIRVE